MKLMSQAIEFQLSGNNGLMKEEVILIDLFLFIWYYFELIVYFFLQPVPVINTHLVSYLEISQQKLRAIL